MANTSPRHMPVLGNVHPIKIENFDIFRDVISLHAQVFILLIDRATQFNITIVMGSQRS